MAVPHDEGRFFGSPPKEKVALPILGEVLSQNSLSLDMVFAAVWFHGVDVIVM